MRDIEWATLPEEHRNRLLEEALAQQPRCESGWTGDRCTLPLDHEGEHDNEADRLQLAYQIADVGRSLEEAGRHYSISELIFEATELTDQDLRVLLNDLKHALHVIDKGRTNDE